MNALPLKFPEKVMMSEAPLGPVLHLEDSWKQKVLLDVSPPACSAHFLIKVPKLLSPFYLELERSQHIAGWLLLGVDPR